MEIFIKVIGKMEKLLAKVYSIIKKNNQYMKENGKMMNRKGKMFDKQRFSRRYKNISRERNKSNLYTFIYENAKVKKKEFKK